MIYKKIKKIHEVDDVEDYRYDIEVQDTHCFFADDMLVHNCRGFQLKHLNDHNMLSRNRKIFGTVDHITDATQIFGKISPDGEIYTHGLDFQTIISLLKKKYKRGEKHVEGTEDLQYWIYDLAIPDKTFLERKKILDSILPKSTDILKRVETIQVNSHAEIKKWHDKWVAEGYEGIMIRDKDAYYGFNSRDWTLMKYKEFFDEEFNIVGHEVEEYHQVLTDTYIDLVIWVCEGANGVLFNVKPRGSVEKRAYWLIHAESYYQSPLMTRFQEYSQDGVPKFGVGVGIRDFE